MSKITKTAARAIVKAAEGIIASTEAFIRSEREAFESRIGRFEVRQAMALSEGADAYVAAELGDWRKWGREILPGKSAPTIYRWRNAGTVARILRGDRADDGTYPNDLLGEVPAALIGSLVPLYRILTDAKTDEERTDAEALVREVYRDVLTKCETFTETDANGATVVSLVPPTQDVVLAAAEAAAPATKGTKTKGSGNKSKGSESETTETPETETDGETRRESSESLTVVEAAKVESAAGPVGSLVKHLQDEHKVSRETVVAIGLAFLRFGSEWGNGTVAAVVGSGADSAVAADVAASETM